MSTGNSNATEPRARRKRRSMPVIIALSILIWMKFLINFVVGVPYSFVLWFVPDKYRRKKTIAGQRVLITGAANGLGRSMALKLAHLEVELYLIDRDLRGLRSLENDIKDMRGQVHIYECDLSDKAQIDKVMPNLLATAQNHIHIAISNAGLLNGKPLGESSEQEIRRLFDVNVLSVIWLLTHLTPGWLQHGQGHFVPIASVLGLWGAVKLTDYCASKHALIGLSESIHCEMKYNGCSDFHTTMVCPSLINTGMFKGAKPRFPKLVPILEPDYAAQKIVDAIRIEKDFLMIPKFYWILYHLDRFVTRHARITTAQYTGLFTSMDTYNKAN